MGWNDPLLEEAHRRVKEWLGAIYRPAQVERAVHVNPDDGERGSIHIRIWTNTNEYRISISLSPKGLDDTYMGTSALSRMPRAGETWTRGNDLPDGKFSDELWRNILAAIVKYEVQDIKSESWKDSQWLNRKAR